MNLLHKTRGSAPINSKQLIFVHAAEPDYADRDRVIKMILESENGGDYAVLYADEGAFPVDFGTPELSRIHLYVPVITKDYLKQCDKGLDFSKLSGKYGFDILPVVQNAGLIPAFNERFKNIHAITLTMENPALEIEKLLSRMLVSAELIEEIIRDGFTRRLFLSYRKKDKAEVDMKYEISEFTSFSGEIVRIMDEIRGDEESFTIPDGVMRIRGFMECPNLRRVTVPASVDYISPHAFKNCPRMEELIIARENEEFKASDGVLYFRKEAIAEDWYAYGRKDVDLTIAEWVQKINPFAFEDCTSIRSVSFPETLTEIGKSAFDGCENLQEITFPYSLRVIGETAFYRCPKINCIDLPKGLEKLGERAFARCEGIEAVIIPDSVRKLEYGVFVNCSLSTIEYHGVCYKLESPSDYLEIEKKIQAKIKEVHPPKLRKIWVKDYLYMDEFEYLGRDSDEEAYGWREKWVDDDYKLKPDERESL